MRLLGLGGKIDANAVVAQHLLMYFRVFYPQDRGNSHNVISFNVYLPKLMGILGCKEWEITLNPGIRCILLKGF